MLWAGVDSHDGGDRALDPGLLERLADRRLGDRLAQVDPADREGPVAVVGAADRQDLACMVGDDRVDGRDEAVGPRRLGGVVVVGPLRARQRVLSRTAVAPPGRPSWRLLCQPSTRSRHTSSMVVNVSSRSARSSVAVSARRSSGGGDDRGRRGALGGSGPAGVPWWRGVRADYRRPAGSAAGGEPASGRRRPGGRRDRHHRAGPDADPAAAHRSRRLTHGARVHPPARARSRLMLRQGQRWRLTAARNQ
jgi:hypothetical protein